MRYEQPYGINDPTGDAPYINGDPSIGRQGSIPPAAAFENHMRELVTLIQSASLTPTAADLTQVFQAVRSQHMNYAIDTGPVNTVTVAFNPPLADSVLPGCPLRVKCAVTNTGPSTMTVDGVQKPLRKMDGSELEANEIVGGGIFEAVWNGGGYWSMTNFLGLGGSGPGTSNTYITKIPYCRDTGTVSDHIIAAFSPPITSLIPGDAIEVNLKNNITGPTDIVVNAMAAKAVVRANGVPLVMGDAVVGQTMLLILGEDGKFQFSGIIPPAQTGGLGVPVGGLILTLGNAAVLGTVKANGAILQRAQHPLLWAFAQASGRLVADPDWQNTAMHLWTSFSGGDGTSTFRVPELRGEFLRFWDDGRGVDVNRVLANQQGDAVGPVNFSGNAVLLNPVATVLMQWTTADGEPSGSRPFDNPATEGVWRSVPFGETWMDQWAGTPQAEHKVAGWDKGYTNVGYPQPRGGQITGQLTITGTGGSNETRGRNAAIVPCIVDG